MVQDVVKTAKSELSKYPMIDKYLGRIIKWRLNLSCPEKGVLISSLLDYDQHSIEDLTRLEEALQLGQRHCRNFDGILQRRGLPQDPERADAIILDMLAEVKAFEYLYTQGFEEIGYLEQKQDVKTVDFTAKRKTDDYAVEVTRVGLPQSDKKKPVYLAKGSMPGVEWFVMSGSDNVEKFAQTIGGAIRNKYPQIEEFCQRQSSMCSGISVISVGRDYFVTEYARRDMDMFPKANSEALEKAWQSLGEGVYKYLHHIVFIPAKDFNKVLTFPEFGWGVKTS